MLSVGPVLLKYVGANISFNSNKKSTFVEVIEHRRMYNHVLIQSLCIFNHYYVVMHRIKFAAKWSTL